MKTAMAYDVVTKNRAMLRLDLLDACNGRCYLCGSFHGDRLEMHEIITRAMTMGNEDARVMSFQRELVSMLCKTCHENANNPDTRTVLMALNVMRFEYEKVCQAIGHVQACMRTRLPLSLQVPTHDEARAILYPAPDGGKDA